MDNDPDDIDWNEELKGVSMEKIDGLLESTGFRLAAAGFGDYDPDKGEEGGVDRYILHGPAGEIHLSSLPEVQAFLVGFDGSAKVVSLALFNQIKLFFPIKDHSFTAIVGAIKILLIEYHKLCKNTELMKN